MAIVFKTPGVIPLEAFTTFGINTKPNTTSPIGFFGTGLKYAVAVLCRIGVEVEVWSGDVCYVFYASKAKFRDKEFNFIRMKRKHGALSKWVGHAKLPFTTELGKNWELWQAFRELESNTRDELGQTFAAPEDNGAEIIGQPGYSLVIVRGDDFAKVYEHRDQVFLPGAVASVPGGGTAQVFDVPSEHMYYRGLRVWTPQKKTIVTWNIVGQMTLTEDRTIASQWMAAYYAARHVVSSTDKNFIKKVLQADENHWEHSLDYSETSHAPTQEFLEVARIYGRRSHLGGYLHTYDPAPPKRFDDWRLEVLDVLSPREGDTVQWDEVNKQIRKHHAKLIGCLRESYNREFPPKPVDTLDDVLGDSKFINGDEPPTPHPLTPVLGAAAVMVGTDYNDIEARVLAQPETQEQVAEHLAGTVDFAGTVTGRLNVPGPETQELPDNGVPEKPEPMHPDFPAAVAAVKADEDDMPF